MMRCDFCESMGPFGLYPAMTAYPHPDEKIVDGEIKIDCGHEECAANDEMRRLCQEDREPNKDKVMCPGCASDYRDFWDEQWREYYAGLM